MAHAVFGVYFHAAAGGDLPEAHVFAETSGTQFVPAAHVFAPHVWPMLFALAASLASTAR